MTTTVDMRENNLLTLCPQVNASTLLDFFNQLGKSPPTEATSSSGGRYSAGGNSLSGALDRVAVKEEPLSEEDLRALQKDRQKKDNHNMSKEILQKI